MPSGDITISNLREARRTIRLNGADRRREIIRITDDALTTLWSEATAKSGVAEGVALAAVGSYGRGEPGPESDLDLVLLHDGSRGASLSELANALFYPLWDANLELDHSVRSLKDCRSVASDDVRAGLALIDLRHIAGDKELTAAAASAVLADWRKVARQRLDSILDSITERHRVFGELGYQVEGNLKDARGGTRDATLLTGLVATWLVERPVWDWQFAAEKLLDVRDALQLVSGRHTHTLSLVYQDAVASLLGYEGDDGADRLLADVSEASRHVAIALDDVVRRAKAVAPGSKIRMLSTRHRLPTPGRKPQADEVAPGIIVNSGELVLAIGADPEDATLPLRLGATSVRTGIPVSKLTARHLGATVPAGPGLPSPWPTEAVRDLVDSLGGGQQLLQVWEVMDLFGLFSYYVPGWDAVRNQVQRSPIHRHTVDRHQVEATVRLADIRTIDDRGLADLSERSRRVVSLATILHDIGKVPGVPSHAERGAEMIRPILQPMGIAEDEIADVEALVRHHLLLGDLAFSADPHAPETRELIRAAVAGEDVEDANPSDAAAAPDGAEPTAVGNPKLKRTDGEVSELVDLLHMLTQSDASSCKPEAWTPWKAQLVAALVKAAR